MCVYYCLIKAVQQQFFIPSKMVKNKIEKTVAVSIRRLQPCRKGKLILGIFFWKIRQIIINVSAKEQRNLIELKLL